MNARSFKLFRILLLLSCLILVHCQAQAQNASSATVPSSPAYGSTASSPYDIQIENETLLIAPLKSRVDIKALWGSENIHGMPATIGNLVKYLRAADTNLNIVVSPGAADVTIHDMTLRSGNMQALAEAVNIATDNKVRGSPLSGKDNWSFYSPPQASTERMVEVFNLSIYIQSLDTSNDEVVRQRLNEVESLILETLRQLHPTGYSSMDDPAFRYHPGTKLLIVTGNREAIEVSRKIVNALSGQQASNQNERLDIAAPAHQK